MLAEELGKLTTSSCGEAQFELFSTGCSMRTSVDRGIRGGDVWREVKSAWSWGVGEWDVLGEKRKDVRECVCLCVYAGYSKRKEEENFA